MFSSQESSRVERGRHRQNRRPAAWVTVAAVIGLLGIAAFGAVGLTNGHRSTAAGCPAARTLRVTAAPEIAAVVAQVAKSTRPGCRSVTVTVTPADSAGVASELRSTTARPDVWIADSSLWVAELPRGSVPTGAAQQSIARSPVVLAVPAPDARRLGRSPTFSELATTATTGHPIVLGASDPAHSAAALGVLVSLRAALDRTAAQRGTLAAVLRTIDSTPGVASARGELPRRTSRSDGSPVALPTTERAVWAANEAASKPIFTAVYPPAPGITLDYPYVVLSNNAARRSDAAALLADLISPAGRAALEQRGFRTSDGAAGPKLTAALGVNPNAPGSAGGTSPSDAHAILSALALLNKPSRLLAAIDVSGSMAFPVPGRPHSTRIGVARAAAGQALGLFPAGTVAGLWQFSAELTSTTDYQELAPLAPLTPAVRDRLAAGVARLRAIPDGGTGLYDTILAAVRRVRSGYDPTRINTVVVLSDGKDEADPVHGISLPTLLATLKAEADPRRPVAVITIAYGPESDDAAMGTISAATGGTLYLSKDPRDLPKIFDDAIGQRLCRSGC